MVEAGDVLMIDCGSTTSLFANALAARALHLTVLTNCLPAVRALGANPYCRVIVCPGDYVRAREVSTDPTRWSSSAASRPIAPSSARAADPDGVTDADSQSCAIKRTMIERADHTTLLLDSSSTTRAVRARMHAVRYRSLVCDAPPPKRLARRRGRRRGRRGQTIAPTNV
jgi:DeoR/GlpR family transcriptional regulator of sugar metabolism